MNSTRIRYNVLLRSRRADFCKWCRVGFESLRLRIPCFVIGDNVGSRNRPTVTAFYCVHFVAYCSATHKLSLKIINLRNYYYIHTYSIPSPPVQLFSFTHSNSKTSRFVTQLWTPELSRNGLFTTLAGVILTSCDMFLIRSCRYTQTRPPLSRASPRRKLTSRCWTKLRGCSLSRGTGYVSITLST